ncbi:hypothetical protein BG011_002212 [Mortierella polycephala]|uniref:VASt domain-containing protein n=1 Tax=Mortierella polycephala TaxID=41804 RepID=A0A9P6Q4X5_9FUNG|nr:hypothetical protein BG011_002212 [Mortierella polycephala]
MVREHQQLAPTISDEHNKQQYSNEYIALPPHSISPAGYVSSLPSTATGYTMPPKYSNGAEFDSASTSQRSSQDADDGSSEARISFIFANEKRFNDFHALFRSVPENEKLIEDYGCALQKEILVQGRLYISENHVCFNANIFGWVTNLVISFSEITAIEKKLTAFVIPNAISIVTTTNTKGHFFASFLSRDTAHDLLMAAWRKSFPCAANASGANYGNSNNNSSVSISGSTTGNNYQQLKRRSRSTVNDEDDTNDAQSFISARGNSESRRNRHRRSFSNASQPWSGEESKDEGINWAKENAADSKVDSGPQRRLSRRAAVRKILKDVIAPIIPDDAQRNGNLSPDSGSKRKGRPRSVSELPPRPAPFDGVGNRNSTTVPRISMDQSSLLLPIQRARAGTESLPLPHTIAHSTTAFGKPPSSSPLAPKPLSAQPTAAGSSRTPTTCQCSKDGRHYTNVYLSETYPGSIESLWKLLFDSNFTKEFLTSEVMKGADVQEELWQEPSADGTSTKFTRYTRWIGMPIGPKTTKAILTDVCEYKNFDTYVTTVTTTSTPDVPSGGCFMTKVRTCITWAGPNQVRIVVTGAVEFTKSSWIKGQIEKGAAEGLTFHYKELDQSLRKHIAAHPKEFVGPDAASPVDVAFTALKATAVESRTPTEDTVHWRRHAQPVAAPNSSSQPRAVQCANGSTKTDHKTSSASGVDLLSGLSKCLPWNSESTGGRGVSSHLVTISVLVVVMLANLYIWRQISNVSSQIEMIQGDIMHPSKAHGSSSRTWPSRLGSASDDMEEDLFVRQQEEIMWAWLMKREARHREYRRKSGVHLESIVRYETARTKTNPTKDGPVTTSESQGSPGIEVGLKARIDELQKQLAALERQASAIEIDAQAIEQDRVFSL